MSLCASGGVREGCLEEVTQEGSKLPGEDSGVPLVNTCLAPRQGRWVWAGLCTPSPRLCSAVGWATPAAPLDRLSSP